MNIADNPHLHKTDVSTSPLFDYIKCPLHRYTFKVKNIREWTENNCEGRIACLNTNRQFIVMEKEQKYYDIILKRVADFNKNFDPQTLFGNEM